MSASRVVCFGEVLWDCLPAGLFLGGAPLNVAYHIARLGGRAAIVSAVGDDVLGREARRRIAAAGIGHEAMATIGSAPTGTVLAELDENGDARYAFPADVAWDRIPDGDAVARAMEGSDAIVFGSLAMRSAANRDLFDGRIARAPQLKLMDVNLRPPFRDRDVILKLARQADVLKMNVAELAFLAGQNTIAPRGIDDAVRRLSEAECERWTICITMGEAGAALFDGDRMIRARAEPVEVADTVGCGDAFMAALTLALLAGAVDEAALRFCAEVGAFAATRSGAMPDYSRDEIDRFAAARAQSS